METVVTPLGVKDIILSDFKKDSVENFRFLFLFSSLPCKSHITLLQSLVAFSKVLIGFSIFFYVNSSYRIRDYGFSYHLHHDFGQNICSLLVAEELFARKADLVVRKLFELTPSDVLGN